MSLAQPCLLLSPQWSAKVEDKWQWCYSEQSYQTKESLSFLFRRERAACAENLSENCSEVIVAPPVWAAPAVAQPMLQPMPTYVPPPVQVQCAQ
eukprot:2061680-Amphidinium_carterae.1